MVCVIILINIIALVIHVTNRFLLIKIMVDLKKHNKFDRLIKNICY